MSVEKYDSNGNSLIYEEWKDIKIADVPNIYQVSTFGRVRSVDRYKKTKTGKDRLIKGRILSPYVDSNGNLHVKLMIVDEYKKDVVISSLMADVFLNRDGDRSLVVRHKNGYKFDNKLSNLELVDRNVILEEISRKNKEVDRFKNPVSVVCINNDEKYDSIRQMCECLRLNYNTVYNKLKKYEKRVIVKYKDYKFIMV